MPTTMLENTNEYMLLEPYQLFAYMCICMICATISVSCSHICISMVFGTLGVQFFAYTCICMVVGTLSVSCSHVYMHGFWNPISSVVRICMELEPYQSVVRICKYAWFLEP